MTRTRTILHVDLDAFFVSCELLRRPELAGRPVVVAGSRESHPGERRNPGRGVVAAASYEARRYGVRSALPLGRALGLCPDLVVLPVDIPAYVTLSERVFAIFSEYTPLVEPGSLDEAFLDLTGTDALSGGGAAAAQAISRRLDLELGLPASVGVATNKVVAKVASDLRKPRGMVVVPAGDEAGFLAPLAVDRLPGAGPKTTAKLRLLGIDTLGRLADAPLTLLQATLGPNAVALQDRARGVDPSPVVVPGAPKSISREETYSEDLVSLDEMETRLAALAAGVGLRLRASSLLARSVTMKVRFANFETVTRRRRLAEPTFTDQDLQAGATALLGETWSGGRPVRLLGVGAEGLTGARQLTLFAPGGEREERLDLALDRLRRRYGGRTIARGTRSLEAPLDWNRDHLRHLAESNPDR
ncbi:MAG TPA: DNA polymerase IV [Candidatus Dormibacteraeota bacterium]|nr:DNA polymerase IV [Candidatus Dormibacteraeota bacterium]